MFSLGIPFVGAFIISLLTTPIMIYLAPRIGLMDIPKDNRRMHKKAIPIGGGVAIYLAVSIITLICFGFAKISAIFLLSSTIILISGIIDDKRGLSPKAKLLCQIAAGAVLIFGGVKIDFFSNPILGRAPVILSYLSIPVTLFWVCGITNTINLIDGLDGLAAGVTMICAIFMLLISMKLGNPAIVTLSAAVAGSCLGFLPYNFNPAKIFMGDTGALYLGFVLAYLSIQGFMKSTALILMLPVLIMGLPVFDTAFAIFRRTLSGRKMMEADKGHLHHRLMERGLGQKKTVLVLYGISFVFGIFAFIIAQYNSSTAMVFSILLIFAIFFSGIALGMLRPGR